jgi:hypothetical protein
LTALTYTGATPTVGADEDTWGTELNTEFAKIAADLAMLNTTPTATILGRTTAATGEVERLTAAQAAALLPAVVGDSGSGGAKGLAPATVAGDKRKVLTGAGTWQAGYGRAFGCIISSTGVNGSTPTIAGTMNVASISNVTEAAGVAYVDLTFTDALPSAVYAVHITQSDNAASITANYANKATGSVRIYFGAYDPTELSVSGFA